MMRNGFSRIGIFCTLGIITICAGCATIYNRLTIDRVGHADLSGFGSAGVTLDAGMVDIIALCRHTDKNGGSPLDTATFRFEALAGHKYEISS